MAPSVDIGVACAAQQDPQWVSGVLAEVLAEVQDKGIRIGKLLFGMTALPDTNKNNNVSDPRSEAEAGPAPAHEKRRNSLTDSNRVSVARGFLGGDSEWLWFLDDDTVPPNGALSSLLSLGKDFVGGVYFLGAYPHTPIAYRRTPDGLYAPVVHYPHGALIEVDSIGMGCTLIHRRVFESIMAGHEVFERANGSLAVVPHKASGLPGVALPRQAPDTFTANGYLMTRIRPRSADDRRPWPFFALEYGRTEDHHFCELAANVGIRPWLDTSVVCKHIKPRAIDRADYRLGLEGIAR
jgi:hypothetical protein